MATLTVSVGGTVLPGDVTSLSRSDELLWSEGTGRAASSGTMTGSVVAKKQTWTLKWGPVTQAQYDAIRSAIGGGFVNLVIRLGSATLANATVYRGSIAADLLGVFGGTAYYGGLSVQLIER